MSRVLSCLWCGARLDHDGKGRPKRFCSHAHRSRHYEWRRLCGTTVSLVALAARDGHGCGVCSGLIDLQASGPLGPTIDHVVPWAQGGTHEIANLQLAHSMCNTRKMATTGFTCEPVGSRPPPLTLF